MSVLLTESSIYNNIIDSSHMNNSNYIQQLVPPIRSKIKHLLKSTNSYKIYCSIIQTLRRGFNKSKKHEILFSTMLRHINTIADDDAIYVYIHNYLNEYIYPLIGAPNNESVSRANNRALMVKSLLSSLHEKGNSIENVIKLVDIGCSKGGITERLKHTLGLTKENTYGLDILPINKVEHAHSFNYIQADETKSIQCFPFDDNSVELVTMLMSLHHIRTPEAYLAEVYRILAPGGILIIREHDCDPIKDPEMSMLLDVLHGLYCISWNPLECQEDVNFSKNYYAQYKSREEWTKIICDLGFIHQINNEYISKMYNMSRIPRTYIHRRTIPNVYLSYWGVYVKSR